MKKEVEEKFKDYPPPIKKRLETIRKLILSEAKDNNLGDVEETLKWGEPAYLVKGGSTVRFDWKEKDPNQYAMYFNCNTKLIDTFKELYGDKFHFEGNRAIIFDKNDALHKEELKHCIKLSLTYHRVKHLPLLGLSQWYRIVIESCSLFHVWDSSHFAPAIQTPSLCKMRNLDEKRCLCICSDRDFRDSNSRVVLI